MTGKPNMLFSGVPEGLDALLLGRIAAGTLAGAEALEAAKEVGPFGIVREKAGSDQPQGKVVLHVTRDDRRMQSLSDALKFFVPDVRVYTLPAWDCVPYDRVSPSTDIVAKRVSTLSVLAAGKRRPGTIVLTTVNAVLQRVPTGEWMKGALRKLAPAQRMDMGRLSRRLEILGYQRTGTVMEPGEYAVRGGILDLFPPGRSKPVRLDFFGDTLESLRLFDVDTQRTSTALNKLVLMPVSELLLGEATRKRFRQGFIERFGAVTGDDPLYETVSAGQRYHGMEHWLPLFHEELVPLFQFIEPDVISMDNQVDEAVDDRLEQIGDHYEARRDTLETQLKSHGLGTPYRPLPPEELYLRRQEWTAGLGVYGAQRFSPFEQPDDTGGSVVVDIRGRATRQFATERADPDQNVFDAAIKHIQNLQAPDQSRKGSPRRTVAIACATPGGSERLMKLMGDHGVNLGLRDLRACADWPSVEALPEKALGFCVLPLEAGFQTPQFALLSEQDILGDRLVRPKRRHRSAADVLTEAASLSDGDLVVHVDHGIGRFDGLRTIEAGGAPHDCLQLSYHAGDKLFLPVENIELLTRYGSDAAVAQLDRLGGAAWQSRKAKLKQRLKEMAEELIQVAAARAVKTAPALEVQEGLYEEFCARFPFEETEDQAASIEAVLGDLADGTPMDRLVCGDVGFGKTEVALRAAFVAAMNGKQVAVVAPTTLLARQHFKTFAERFKGFPLTVRQASRMLSQKELNQVKAELREGKVDVVVGTHALLGKGVDFADLGLLIIDEEQHFGVQHKEKLKQLREDIHVLTLTATPIPRTLQLSLSGVRELSLITTPPVDRLAVRTYVTPFDAVVLRDALLRERFRDGQSFYVCPRISDLDEVATFLREGVPELKFGIAHGQMAPGQLDDVMNAFYDKEYDVLLATTIVESGLDIPSANTIILHRADMFGLAQLYQLRGRVGRSKRRAYAYLTTPHNKKLTDNAQKRLKVLQSLDSLGAGFTLASHDLDIRGAGNLLGEEQSGHIKEVGFELYQSMLEEAINALKEGGTADVEDVWSPQIALGTPVLLPESYIADLQLRLTLYRRLSNLADRAQIDDFNEELTDRFGTPPDEVRHLLEIVEIKGLCRRANIAQIDGGPKGASVTFRHNKFPNPAGLARFASEYPDQVSLGADHKLVYRAGWDDPDRRVAGARALTKRLAELAEEDVKAAA